MKEILIAASICLASTQAIAERLDANAIQNAKCAGIIEGNAVVDYASDTITERQMYERFVVGLAGYLPSVLGSGASDEAIAKYDSVVQGTAGEIINVASNGGYSAAIYEQVIGCYQRFALQSAASNMGVYKNIIDKTAQDAVHNFKAYLGN